VQSDWQAHVAKVRSDVAAAKADRDASRAERSEDDALAAVAFVLVAREEAEYRILDAALSRVEADALATA